MSPENIDVDSKDKQIYEGVRNRFGYDDRATPNPLPKDRASFPHVCHIKFNGVCKDQRNFDQVVIGTCNSEEMLRRAECCKSGMLCRWSSGECSTAWWFLGCYAPKAHMIVLVGYSDSDEPGTIALAKSAAGDALLKTCNQVLRDFLQPMDAVPDLIMLQVFERSRIFVDWVASPAAMRFRMAPRVEIASLQIPNKAINS